MKVKLAVQVLSKSVAIALRETGREDVIGTTEFCEMMNGFFDCTNVRSLTEHQWKKNSFIMPRNRSAFDMVEGCLPQLPGKLEEKYRGT